MDVELTTGQFIVATACIFVPFYFILVCAVGLVTKDWGVAFLVVSGIYVATGIIVAAVYGVTFMCQQLPI